MAIVSRIIRQPNKEKKMPEQIREEGFLVFQQGTPGGWFGKSREQAEKFAKSLTNTKIPIYVVEAVVFADKTDRITRMPE
jgi:hypothetical protein